MKRLAGVDVGGTFTDIAFWDSDLGVVEVHKLLTTPEDPTVAIAGGLDVFAQRPELVVHGTTLVTNALIERRGARTGLITTDGYRDVLEIASELRYDAFDLFLTRPEPLVARPLRLAVQERMDAAGNEVLPLDEEAVREAGRQLVEAGVGAIAVAFFNAYRNPAHELRALEVLREALPEVQLCASHQIAPEIREYERFSTAVANAYVQPLATQYLNHLASKVGTTLMVMLSDGGITTARNAAAQPIALVESGPAAGAMWAAHMSKQSGGADMLAFDMGGTTAKVSLVHDGVPQRTHEMEVARVHRFKKGSGLPVRLPTVALIEIGAGGGSIATVDDLGLLKVGPRSAGASPGPACYGQGGSEATVTDANLHLGYLAADSFLGGQMRLDERAADRALEKLAVQLDTTPTTVAAGVFDVVNNNMATAARLHIAEQARDPRRYRMIAFGGAGPVHAYGLARMLHVGEVVFPRAAGVASAIGMLVAPRSVEQTKSLVVPLDDPDWQLIGSTIDELETAARALLGEAGVASDDMTLEVSADIRYVGQGYEVTVPIPLEVMRARQADSLVAAFETEYRDKFDRILPGMPAEVISWRLRALSSPVVHEVVLDDTGLADGTAYVGTRRAYFAEAGGFVETPVYRRAHLDRGTVLDGPALVEETESTVVVGPSARVRIDDAGNLIMTLRGSVDEG